MTISQVLNTKKAIAVIGLGGLAAFSLSASFASAQWPQFDPEHDFSITKQVQNLRSGSGLATSVSANPGDRVHFQINFNTTGYSSQDNVTIRDDLPYYLQFVSGSLRLDGNVVVNEPMFFNTGINLGTLAPNSYHTASFDANAASYLSGYYALTNTADVFSSQIYNREASAQVIVNGGPVNNGTGSTYDLFISKQVLNVTRGEVRYQDSVTANPGDRVRFEIRVNTLGNSWQTNVIVRDSLSSQLSFVTATQTLDGSMVGNQFDLFDSGLKLGGLSAGMQKTIRFEANVASLTALSSTTIFSNTANVRSDQVAARQASATVYAQLILGISFQQRQTAFNLTQGVDATATVANPGDTITYTLYYRNTGFSPLIGVTIQDDIASVLELAQMTNTGGAVVDNNVIRFGQVNLEAGAELARSFQVQIREAKYFPANSDLVMVNVYGNELMIPVRKGAVAGLITVTPPRTGAGEWLAGILAIVATAGYWVYRRKKTKHAENLI